MTVLDTRPPEMDPPDDRSLDLPLQSGRCPRCGNRTRTLRYEEDHLEARCSACGTELIAWRDLLVAW